MNITIIEKEGYEADDILGTLSVMAEKKGIDVALLTGDRDSFNWLLIKFLSIFQEQKLERRKLIFLIEIKFWKYMGLNQNK